MFNSQEIQKNWPQIKTAVLNKWNKLSESDIEQTQGNPQSLSKLVNSKYGTVTDFDKTYENICQSKTSSRTTNDIETRSQTSPAAEAGMPKSSTESTDDNFSHETDDELSAYSPASSTRLTQDDPEVDNEYMNLDNQKTNTQFTAPDEFTPSQDPSPSREDITLGRNTSSATKISTAKAAPNSSEASYDAKKKI